MTALLTRLAAALLRVVPYLDLLPASAAQEIREALRAYDEGQK